MPLIGGSSGVIPTTSSDGVLTAFSDPVNGWVEFLIDFTLITSPNACFVTVTRTVNGVSLGNVRGLDHYTAPGGVAVGIDNEAPFRTVITYQAFAFDPFGVKFTSTSVAVVCGATGAFLKSPLYPVSNQPLAVEAYPNWESDIEQGVFYPLGAKYPVVVTSARRAATGTLTVDTRSPDAMTGLQAALDPAQPFYLLQGSAVSGEPDRYVTVGKQQVSRPYAMSMQPKRMFDLPLVEVARPATLNSRVSMPGHTYADSAVRWARYTDRVGQYRARALS